MTGADAGLSRGEGIYKNYAQYACANGWLRPLSASHGGQHQYQGKEVMVLSSEIIEIAARLSDFFAFLDKR